MSYGGGATTQRAARLPLPYQLVQAAEQVLSCPVYTGSDLVAPTGGTRHIERPNGTEAATGSVTITASIATAVLTTASLPATETRGPRWQVRWVLTFAASPTVEEIIADAALCRRPWRPTVTEHDLYQRMSSLDPDAANSITAKTSHQDKIDLAAGKILRDLYATNQRPELITTPSALHDLHRNLTLAMIFEDLSTNLNPDYRDTADRFLALYKGDLQRLTFRSDTDDSGRQDGQRKGAKSASFWLGGYPMR
jgi:hypothetical protein